MQEADKREQEDAAEAATERAEREQHEQRWAWVMFQMSGLLGCWVSGSTSGSITGGGVAAALFGSLGAAG